MLIHKCDKCGREIDNMNPLYIVAIGKYTNRVPSAFDYRYEVCTSCANDAIAVLQNRYEKEAQSDAAPTVSE